MLMSAAFMDSLGIPFNVELHNMKYIPGVLLLLLIWKSLPTFCFSSSSVLEMEPCFEAGHGGEKAGSW